MLSRFVLFLPSAFCGATVFVNGALSHDFDAFARREREGWQIWILHLTASVRVGGTSPTAQECEHATPGNVLCARFAESERRRKPEYVFFTCVVLRV